MVQAMREVEREAVEGRGARELPRTLAALGRISENYWWSWASGGEEVFRDLDPEVWEECGHNPRRLLAETPELNLMRMACEPDYTGRVARLAAAFDRYMTAGAETWAARSVGQLTSARPVAYFCAEFGIHNSLPLYSGGLGVLAGDHLKSASDLGLPLVAVGLLYHQGYFHQRLRRDGWQEESYRQVHLPDLPLERARDAKGEPLAVELEVRGRRVLAQAWLARVGRVSLYLLDTNIDENHEIDRLITGHLYGGDRETRCVQEMVLGVGGVRLLRRLGVAPSVFHLNEGHSAFLTLELTREMTARGVAFEEAADSVRSRCVFTTHTPIAAGHDEFTTALVERCFGADYWRALGLTREEFFDLGRVNAGDQGELFGLTPLALRMCRSSNGVSRKHGEVSRELWLKMWPGRTAGDVPITHVTNGVHAPTWVSPLLRSIYERRAGRDWADALRDPEEWAARAESIPDEELWDARRLLKRRLIAFVRQRLYHQRAAQNEEPEFAEAARTMFDPDALTIGFARRVAAYKRWSLILSEPERLLRLINNPERPVQLVFAGKAHPQDQGAKLILQQLALWKLDPRVMRRAVFLQDYDHEIARQLVQSVDVWMNVPRRPLEASGTSGQKVAMNGGLNLSVLDGWWPEGFDGTNGWAVGEETPDGVEGGDDRLDAESLYRTLEAVVVPAFYERDEAGVPRRWVGMMRRAIQTLGPAFNSDRMVQEYAQKIYT
jgi:starch phosphorylase